MRVKVINLSPNSKILGTEAICKCCSLMLLNITNRSYGNLTFNSLYEAYTIPFFILQAELSVPSNHDQGRGGKRLYTPVHSSSFHNSQWVQTTQCPLMGRWVHRSGLPRQCNTMQPSKGWKHRHRLRCGLTANMLVRKQARYKRPRVI